MNENEYDDWLKDWHESNEALEAEIAENCRAWVRAALKDCGETIEARLMEAEDEGRVTDAQSERKFRRMVVRDLKKRAERRFYRALGEGKIIL